MKKEARVLTAPTGQLKSEILSIEELKRKNLEQNTVSTEDISLKPRTPFTYDQLKMQWKAFAYEIKRLEKSGAETVFSIMTKREPKLDDFKVTYEVENEVLYQLFVNTFGDELVHFLRNKLNNWGITLEVNVVESKDEMVRSLNGKDRFEQMSKKNINLITLQKIFNLDVEL